MSDFAFFSHGSITILTPSSPAAEQWVEDHIPEDAQMWGDGVVIEPRYAEPILEAILAEGMSFSTEESS